MSDTDTLNESGLTRREILKRGAVLGGALVWGTPVVQVIGMRPAMAQSTSPDCPNLYCLKAEVSGGSLGSFGPLGGGQGGQGQGQGNCITEDEDCNPNVPAAILNFLNNNVTGTPETGFTVILPPGCTLAELTGGSPDQFLGGVSAATKCGKKGRSGNPCFVPVVYTGNGTTTLTFMPSRWTRCWPARITVSPACRPPVISTVPGRRMPTCTGTRCVVQVCASAPGISLMTNWLSPCGTKASSGMTVALSRWPKTVLTRANMPGRSFN